MVLVLSKYSIKYSISHHHHHHHHHHLGFDSIKSNKMLISQRDRAAGCVIVYAKSKRLELGLQTL